MDALRGWRLLAKQVTNAVAMPVPMKVRVATSERPDRREIPQMPWPLVQPEPRRVPKPTSNPARMTAGSETGEAPMAVGITTPSSTPPSSKPAKKAIRQ